MQQGPPLQGPLACAAGGELAAPGLTPSAHTAGPLSAAGVHLLLQHTLLKIVATYMRETSCQGLPCHSHVSISAQYFLMLPVCTHKLGGGTQCAVIRARLLRKESERMRDTFPAGMASCIREVRVLELLSCTWAAPEKLLAVGKEVADDTPSVARQQIRSGTVSTRRPSTCATKFSFWNWIVMVWPRFSWRPSMVNCPRANPSDVALCKSMILPATQRIILVKMR